MILWVDDDILASLRPFVEELQDNKYLVEFAKNPDEMWSKIKNSRKAINGIIMDIMMPTGSSIKSTDAEMGLSTGLILLKQLKEDHALKETPILIFTIVDKEEVYDWANENGIQILKKQEVLPFELVEKIIELGVEHDG